MTNPTHRAAALAKANQIVGSLRGELSTAAWFHDNRTRETLDQIERAFEASCERWRSLYRAAVRQRVVIGYERTHLAISDGPVGSCR